MEKYDGLYEFSVTCKKGDYYTECSTQDFFSMYNWMTSFTTGMAPLFYMSTKDNKYLKWANKYAQSYTDKVFKYSMDTMHDIGFLYSPYSVAMYKLTGDSQHRIAAIKAADELLKRFDINGKYIDAWQRMDNIQETGRAIIDCMMNIQLLFWAWKETGHMIYHDVAKAHADTTIKYFVREDYSVCHSFEFERKTGKMIYENNGCGYENGSHWARGTAWMVYGLAGVAKYLDDRTYYDIAEKIALKYIESCGEKCVPVWDFRLPEDKPALECGHYDNPEWDGSDIRNCGNNVDASAASIFASGLLELNKYIHNDTLERFALDTVTELCENYLNKDMTVAGVIHHQNGQMLYTTIGDYFFTEALHKILFDIDACW